MSIANQINKLLVSEIPQISKAARRANQFTEELEGNLITKDEYDNLLEDLLRLDKIDQSMVTLEAYREIAKAYQILLTLKTLTTLL